nr:hypothetical protein [Candidatus Sigynarchaeota archaeon]
MSKDKIIGAVILFGAGALLVFYSFWLVGGYIHEQIDLNGASSWWNWAWWFPSIPGLPWQLAVILPMWLVAILVLAIAIWIGYSMLTTPPPVPLEELEEELEAEEKKKEEKKDDAKK